MRIQVATTESQSGASAIQAAFVRALRRLLRPLVHLLVARQVPYPVIANLLKSVYVEVADCDFPLEGKRQTDSRISLLTGVHRKDVKRLRGELEEGELTPSNVSLGAQLVARWQGSSDFLDENGGPRPLPPQPPDDNGASFEKLVASVSTDIRPRSVLDEWLRLGVVHFDDRGRVALKAGVFVPQKGFEEKLSYFGRNLHDHIAAAAHNVLGHQPPFVERSVHYADLSPEAVDALKRLAEERGMQALRAVNREALELKERSPGGSRATRRLHFGVYLYEAESEEGK